MVIKKIKKIYPSLLVLLSVVLLILGLYNSFFLFLGISLLCIITILEWVIVSIFEKSKLSIVTPDGSNEPLHPSVIYTGTNRLNGFCYWMAFTPYPIKSKIYRDRYECPCVISSNDGLKWNYPGDVRYIDDLTDKQILEKDYFSDPELVMENDTLHMYYRLSTGGINLYTKNVEVFRKSTKDGIVWSERKSILFETGKENYEIISPTIIYNDNMFILWFVSGKKWHRKIYRMISDDGINWYSVNDCKLNGYTFDPWHIDCKIINSIYILTVYDMSENLVLLTSNDGIVFKVLKTAIVPSRRIYSFYRSTLYRASLCFDGNEYKMYFTAGNDRKNSIGIMTGRTLETMTVKSATKGLCLMDFLSGWINKYLYPYYVFFKKVKGILCQS